MWKSLGVVGIERVPKKMLLLLTHAGAIPERCVRQWPSFVLSPSLGTEWLPGGGCCSATELLLQQVR